MEKKVKIYVKKASGGTEFFDKEKIKRTCIRSGASKKLAEQIANQVEKRIYNGISTRNILKMALVLLVKDQEAEEALAEAEGKNSVFTQLAKNHHLEG